MEIHSRTGVPRAASAARREPRESRRHPRPRAQRPTLRRCRRTRLAPATVRRGDRAPLFGLGGCSQTPGVRSLRDDARLRARTRSELPDHADCSRGDVCLFLRVPELPDVRIVAREPRRPGMRPQTACDCSGDTVTGLSGRGTRPSRSPRARVVRRSDPAGIRRERPRTKLDSGSRPPSPRPMRTTNSPGDERRLGPPPAQDPSPGSTPRTPPRLRAPVKSEPRAIRVHHRSTTSASESRATRR